MVSTYSLFFNMMVIDNKYELGQIVYLKTDPEQAQRIVTGITVRISAMVYELSCGVNSSGHYEFEITETENELIKVK